MLKLLNPVVIMEETITRIDQLTKSNNEPVSHLQPSLRKQNMNKKVIIIGISTIVILVICYFLFFSSSSADTNKFTFAKVTRGDISTTITSTGTIQAVTTVDVGTQVSGKIDKILVDFNSKVKKGQLLAVLDTTNLSLAVNNARTGLQKAQASYEISKATFERDSSLYAKNFISELDYITSNTNFLTAVANLSSARSSLSQAKTSLNYAYIYSPINGVIINRNVEEGQTVAASLQAPTLFTIAEDLSKMQILANVDEADIGQIKVNQNAAFTVEAYPDKKFYGKVVQIRLGSTTVSNVVNYTVVINSDNNEGLLLPGMTATIDFYIDQQKDVLLIPNAALRFQPTPKMVTDFQARMKQQYGNVPDSLKQRFNARINSGGGNQSGSSSGAGNRARGTFWFLDANGDPEMGFAQLGITDGKNTEILKSKVLKEGLEVITGTEASGNNTNKQNTNIFNPNPIPGGGPRRF